MAEAGVKLPVLFVVNAIVPYGRIDPTVLLTVAVHVVCWPTEIGTGLQLTVVDVGTGRVQSGSIGSLDVPRIHSNSSATPVTKYLTGPLLEASVNDPDR